MVNFLGSENRFMKKFLHLIKHFEKRERKDIKELKKLAEKHKDSDSNSEKRNFEKEILIVFADILETYHNEFYEISEYLGTYLNLGLHALKGSHEKSRKLFEAQDAHLQESIKIYKDLFFNDQYPVLGHASIKSYLTKKIGTISVEVVDNIVNELPKDKRNFPKASHYLPKLNDLKKKLARQALEIKIFVAGTIEVILKNYYDYEGLKPHFKKIKYKN